MMKTNLYFYITEQKEIDDEQEKHDKEQKLMDAEYNKFKNLFETEQKQHQNTQKVLSDTVSKVKKSIKEINERAHQKAMTIQRLQQRLQLYKQHLDRYLMNQQVRTDNNNIIKPT